MKTLDTSNKFKSAGVMNNILMGIAVLTFITGYSCREEELFQTSDGIKEISVLKNAAIIDCENQCIDPDNPVYFESTDSKTITWGNPSNPKTNTVEITCYNTLTHFILKVRSTNGWSDLVIDGISSWVNGPVGPGEWGEYSVELPSGWAACDDYGFSLQVAGNGPPALFDVIYQLVGSCKGTFTDLRDGRAYKWVQIGTQKWMAENLNHGTKVDCSVFQSDNDIVEKYCLGSWNGDCALYGGLYQWNEMMDYSIAEKSRGICPEGWHIPDKSDWQTLLDKIRADGYDKMEGSVLKSTTGWIIHDGINGNGTDIYGFCALPGGDGGWGYCGPFHGGCARFWSSTPFWNIYIEWWQKNLSWYNLDNSNPNAESAGMSVRCIKDSME